MALVPVAGAIAASTAGLAYLDAKFHITKDVRGILGQRAAQRALEKTAQGKGQSLWYQFEAQVRRLPSDEEAIWSRTGCYTWAEAYANACRYGQFMLQAGVQPGKLVAMYMMNRPEFLFTHLGSWSIGSAPAWINYNLAGDALVHCLKVAEAKVIVVDEDEGCRRRIEEVRDRLEGELGMKIVVLDQTQKGEISRLEPKRPGDELRVGAKGKFPLFLFYTSGTTGHPKACPFETQRAAGLTGRVGAMGLKTGPNGDRWYVCMPLYHGTGGTTGLVCMVTGITCCIGTKFSTSRFWTDVRDSRSTAIVYVGETARYLINTPPSPLDKKHNVRAMYGNGLRPDVWQRFVDRFGIEVVGEFFNSTEGVMALFNSSRGPFTATSVGHQGLINRWRFHNTYVPVEVDVVTGELIRDPKTGFCKRKAYEEGSEILIQMPHESAFVGYYNNAEATQKRFERNVFKKGDLYYRTGDALRRDADGRWFFMDRLGDTFRWKSENVSTAEVAEALGSFPGISEANVYGVEVPGHDGRAGCAAINIASTHTETFDFNGLLAHAKSKLPKYAVPVFLRVLKYQTSMHNNKQNKVPLRNDGIDLRKIMDRADKEAAEKGTGGVEYDTLYWHPAALAAHSGLVKEDRGYVVFTMEDWDQLKGSAGGVEAKLNLKRSKADSEDGDVPGLDTLTTASLAKLQSTDERRLLDVVDKLRRTGLNGTIELPQLVVCGDQSSGKSSVLEAITEIPFPRKAGLCTRFATEIILRRESKISVTVKIVPSKYRSEAEQKTLSAFNKTMLYVNQLPDLIDAATQEMGLGKIGASKAFSRDVLSVEICGPDRPQLTLVDLPGLIHSATKASSEEDKRLIHALVGEYMQNPRTIILAVVSAKNDAANQVILSLFKEYDKTGSRTLGIITKPDCMSAEDQQQWFDLALNKEVFLERGWHIVKNWTEPNVQHTAKQRNDAERAFFKEGPFKDFPPHMIGVEALCDRLSKLLLRHLTQELPSLQREMQSKLDDTNTELMKLGDKRETPAEQRMVLMKISMKINHIIASAVNGHYLHEFFGTVDLESSVESNNNIRRFRAVVQNLNHEFAENMRTRGHTYSFESEEEKNKAAAQAANESGEKPGEKSGGPLDANADAKSNAKSDEKSEKPTKKQRENKKASIKDTDTDDDLPTPKRLSYDEAMDWVKDTIVRCRGHELPGSVNPEVTSHLFWEQSVPWRAITQDHIAKVRAVCKEFICQILEHAAPTEFVKPLEDLLITSALEQTHEDANKEFGKLLTDNARHPSTYDHTYSDSLQKKRNKKYSDLTAFARQAATTPQYLATDGKPAGTQFDSAMFQQLMSWAVERNMLTFAAEEALESQNAYYADKLRYFIHAVTCQVVERCMVDPLPLMLLSPMVVTGMSDEQVEFVAGELPETVLRRAFFQERKAMLEMGFGIFRDAVGGVKRVRTCL